MTTPAADEVIQTYLRLRARKDAIENDMKDRVADIKTKMTKLEAWLQAKCDEIGATSLKTPHGTAFITTLDTATVADWDATLAFVKANNAYDLLERRVSKTAVRAYIDENKSVPDGVTFGTRLNVNVRKPTNKGE